MTKKIEKKLETKTEKKPEVFEGTIVVRFKYKKKYYYPDTVFKTEDEKLFNHLLKTNRIRK